LKLLTPNATPAPATGICKVPPRGKLGDPCFQTCAPGQNCSSTYSTDFPDPPLALCYESDGLFCSRAAVDARCAPLPAVGDACSTTDGCGSTLFCGSASVCSERQAAGAPCLQNSECAKGLGCVNAACAPVPIANDKTCSGNLN
jgi:hypothetical protein